MVCLRRGREDEEAIAFDASVVDIPLNLWYTLTGSMVSNPAEITSRTRRQSLAAILALLWGVYALLGASGLCSITSVQGLAPQVHNLTSQNLAQTSPTPAPTCHCRMCHGMMHGGKCCCCCKAVRTPQQQAIITARCDQGAPAVLVAVTSWPVVRPGLTASFLPRLGRPYFVRPGDQFAFSVFLLPLPSPP